MSRRFHMSPESQARMGELLDQCRQHIAAWEATLTGPDDAGRYYARKGKEHDFWWERMREARAAGAPPDLIAAIERVKDLASYVGD